MKKIRIAAAAVFLVMLLFALPATASAASVGETVSQATADELRAVDYNNNTIKQLLSCQLDTEVNVISYETAFEEVQANIEEIICGVVNNADGWEPNRGEEYFISKIQKNKEKLLLGLAYIERLYDFNMGGCNIRDDLFYNSLPYDVPKGISDVLDWLIYIGGIGGERLKISNNYKEFYTSGTIFGAFGDKGKGASLESLLEYYRQKNIRDTSMNEWFVQESRAYILEKSSDWDTAKSGLYRRLYDNEADRAYILPLLTVSEDSVYVIANSATITYGIVDCYIDRTLKENDPTEYGKKREEFRKQLEQAANQQTAFIDFWHRIAKPEKRESLLSNRAVYDSLRIYSGTSASAGEEWSEKGGKNASRGVREFFTPLKKYVAFSFVDGEAQGQNIRYYLSKALMERGFRHMPMS